MPRNSLAALKELYDRYNDPDDTFTLRGIESEFIKALQGLLGVEEEVLTLIAFRHESRSAIGKPQLPLATLLTVTSDRVIAVQESGVGGQLLNALKGNRDHLLGFVEFPYSSLKGVDGRKTVLDFGKRRELYLDRPDGSFVKIAGMTTHQSLLAQHKIEQAMRRRVT